jgi:CheY-like chemotaxis protein/anti-sigma regulatory factor (Ser/Thr protein kinase)
MSRILVIDDDPATQSLTAKALQARGFQALTAGDGREGLDIAKRYVPDLIICDIQMPEMDGFETLAALQRDPVTSSIPFVFLTGLSDQTHVRFGMGLGADDYLTKPFTVNELMEAVNLRLAKKAAVQRVSERKLDTLRSNIGQALPHELLTPLNGILGLSDLLADEQSTLGAEEVRDFARNIQISALRLHRLIGNFLLYSELELIRSDPKRMAELRRSAATPVKETLVRVAQEKAEASAREADLVLEVEDGLVVMGPERFRKLAEELLDNAFKFSRTGTPVRVVAQACGKQYLVGVHDHGRGMTPEQIASIGAHMQFERRFYEQQGAGLGLILAKRLTEIYGGEMTVESILDERTSVQILLARPAFPR